VNKPLMVRMSTHEVNGREVERSPTGGTARDLEDLRRRVVRESFDLPLLCGRLRSIRRNERSVLQRRDRNQDETHERHR
jgi:hypothetical protein